MNWNKISNRLFGFFIKGLLLLAPVYFTVTVLWSVLSKLDDQFSFKFPGTGLLILVVFVLLVGFIGSTFIAVPVFRLFETTIGKLPLVRLIYFSIKDLINAFVGDKKKFDKPVLLTLNADNNIFKLGFITSEPSIGSSSSNELISVYCPHSYAFSGEMYLVKKESVELLNISASDLMKYIVSGGVSVQQD